jgi:predicted secreted hydrolase
MKGSPIMPRCPLRIVILVVCLGLVLGGCSFPGMIPPGQALPPAAAPAAPTPLPGISLPQDDGPHHDLTEWWYYTGHVAGIDASGTLHSYGFELTFFQISRGSLLIYVGHFGITDLTHHTYVSQQLITDDPATIVHNSTTPPGSGFNLIIANWAMRGRAGNDDLAAITGGYAIAFHLVSTKPAALHNGNGILASFGLGFSYYYSRTHLLVTGTMQDHGSAIPVTGIAWMDHQWGNFLIDASISWDWFSLQMDDDVEYMVFFLNDRSGNRHYFGATRISADGRTTAITTGLAEVALGQWTSPTTHITYPSGWQLALPDGMVTVTPDLASQEFVAQDSEAQATYWEGACTAQGILHGQIVHGQAYVELTGRQPPDP